LQLLPKRQLSGGISMIFREICDAGDMTWRLLVACRPLFFKSIMGLDDTFQYRDPIIRKDKPIIFDALTISKEINSSLKQAWI